MGIINFKAKKKIIEKKNKVKIKSEDQPIEIRDLRDKFYMVDDTYINGYARICGTAASMVYHILCRHAGRDQSCFPSIGLMADKLGISGRVVIRSIKVLEIYGIIKVDRVPGERSKYWLTDKSTWKDKKSMMYYGIGGGRRATKAERSKVKVEYPKDE